MFLVCSLRRIAYGKLLISNGKENHQKLSCTISDIPKGWTIKSGETAADAETVTVTDGTANYIPVENVVVITPVNIPLGKKIKSIKAVPAE